MNIVFILASHILVQNKREENNRERFFVKEMKQSERKIYVLLIREQKDL